MKWEYDYVYPTDRPDKLQETIAVMKDMGRDGWELVSVDNGIAYFKRPLLESQKDILRQVDKEIESGRI